MRRKLLLYRFSESSKLRELRRSVGFSGYVGRMGALLYGKVYRVLAWIQNLASKLLRWSECACTNQQNIWLNVLVLSLVTIVKKTDLPYIREPIFKSLVGIQLDFKNQYI